MRGVDKITEKNVAGAMKQVKRALLDADVNLRVVNSLIKQIKLRAIGEKVTPGVEPGQMLIKIMHEELTAIMGKDQAPLARRTDGVPTVVLLAGLQGAGKTTAAAKLALYCMKENRSVMLIAGDVYRPAAIDQLKTLGSSIDVEVYSLGTEADPRDIVRKGIEKGMKDKIDTLIVDTAGRQVIDSKLMKELKDIKTISNADETLLVVDAMTGQEAATLTKSFNEEVGITGAILTKLDGDTRGGAALSVQQVSGAPIKFTGVGERVEKLQPFIPERMASRILGMGDVLTFVEKAQEEMDEKEAEKMTKRMMEAKFDFNDFLKQTKMISTMGSLAGVMKMLPGVGSISSSKMAQAEAKLKLADSLIKSMTIQERTNPELLYSGGSARSRLTRISKGAGRSRNEAEDLVSDFKNMRSMMSRMSKQMLNGQDGPNGAPGQAVGNRSQRRKAGKKKAQKRSAKRGFG
ncbi:signal recognition particle SRP54 ffh [Gracilaria domingensis]|nr:signal recognition particle SRP54 ffh [Gracilaria domingensis]